MTRQSQRTRFEDSEAKPRVVLLRDPPYERRLSMERYADAVQRGLTQRGAWEVIPTAPMVPDNVRPRGRGWDSLGGYWLRFGAYPVAAARRRGDVWHVCDQGYAHLAALLPYGRTVVTCHDLMLLRSLEGVTGFRGSPTSVMRFRWSASYLRKVAHVMCDSTATQEDVIRLAHAAPERTTVVPLGVEEHFRPLSPQTRRQIRHGLGYPGDELIILSVGRDAYKNPLAGIDCLAAIRARGVDAHLIRSGAPLADVERDYVHRARVPSWVHEQGIVSDQRLVELYNAADVLLHPSFWEGFGWPPLEAMACGTPAVVSTAPSLVEVIGEAGIAAVATDIRGLADAILRVTTPEHSADWRRRALHRAESFSWEGTLQSITSVYDRVRAEARHAESRTR